jgi:hypothetical protein
MEQPREVIHKNGQPMKIHLQKVKGGYTWEIHAYGGTVNELLPLLREADRKLRNEFKAVS